MAKSRCRAPCVRLVLRKNLNAIDTWLPLALAELLEGIGGGILSPHSQSTSSVFHTVRILKERGELNLLKGIIIPEGAGTDLAAAGLVGSDFDSIPFPDGER
jgi:hypothetical protein